ncbi:uncharacterized protein Z520_09508 [Fonsecaea multimorphosa CBS 102226]|uniref:Nudix hydrolase domain-containing protein n=1 Tax=Fonsecaea multimorphosa CBS 102226 TaxID=1442371 RepID=A0A0D2KDN7_9EURO|nr:uncharacterized protein Z520_09508 [Fonsecaea multimorphosa CBS 102226]KIX94818.1 hypothetical protein Z520_09508 [Fonsecaea multimorphosa CBS 102226]OAL20396.1 hypothetical protein AYO22_08890 [Fonsecaea multimorphosa]
MPSPPDLLASSVPRVGVAVFILHADPSNSRSISTTSQQPKYKFLLGKRLGSHGAGTWALPGGHLEFGESFEECAAREVCEETGLDVAEIEFLTATNDVMPFESSPLTETTGAKDGKVVKGKHYVTIFMTARVQNDDDTRSGMPEAKLLEPDKCAGWEWVSWDELVRWAGPQLKQLGWEVEGAGEGDGDGSTDRERDARTLFSPMIALLVQRPGVIPGQQ